MSLAPRRDIGIGGGVPTPRDQASVVRQLLRNLTQLEKQVEEKTTQLERHDAEWREKRCEEAHFDEKLRELNAQLAKEELEEARLKLEIVTLRNAYEAGGEWDKGSVSSSSSSSSSCSSSSSACCRFILFFFILFILFFCFF